MTVEYMRDAIAAVYGGKKWLKKVNKMDDNQVIAVYYSFLNSGKFDEKPSKKKSRERNANEVVKENRRKENAYRDYVGRQLSIDDIK